MNDNVTREDVEWLSNRIDQLQERIASLEQEVNRNQRNEENERYRMTCDLERRIESVEREARR